MFTLVKIKAGGSGCPVDEYLVDDKQRTEGRKTEK
jgi:hypothetical protein